LATSKRKLMANSASGLAERFVNLFVQVWLYQYLIKRISPEEYSLYPVVTALLVFVPPLTIILTAGLSRSSVEAHARDEHRRVTEITSTVFPMLLGTAFALLGLGLLVTRYLDSIVKIAPQDLFEGRLMAILLFGSLSLRVALLPFSVGLYIRQRFVLTNSLIMVQTLIRVTLLFVLLLGVGPRVIWVVVSAVSADVPILLITTFISVRSVPSLRFRFTHIRWELLRELMATGFWNMISSIGILIRKSSDLLVLNRFASAIDVNTFHLASITDNQLDSALGKIIEPMAPHMVSLQATGGPKALQGLYLRGTRYCMWAALFVATPLVAFRQQLWSHYLGATLQTYAAVPIVMVLLLARYWVEPPLFFIGIASYATNRMKPLSLLVIGTSIFNVAITVYFVYYLKMGAIGSALGTLIAVLIWDPLTYWLFGLPLLEMKFLQWLKGAIWVGILPSLTAGLFAAAWNYGVQPDTIPKLILATALTCAVFVLSIVLFCLGEDERRYIRQVLAKVNPQRSDTAVHSQS
jgi:O-antigen/teichoic acid export membrane protein